VFYVTIDRLPEFVARAAASELTLNLRPSADEQLYRVESPQEMRAHAAAMAAGALPEVSEEEQP